MSQHNPEQQQQQQQQQRQRVVLLQYGSHGTSVDFRYLESLLRERDPSVLLLQPNVNDLFRTDDGVVVCGTRLANYCVDEIEKAFPLPRQSNEVIEFSVVAHSMGGLIVREALPSIFERAFSASGEEGARRVEWKTLCCVAVPHCGTTNMPSLFHRYVGRFIGWIYSTAYYDMFRPSEVLTERLLQPSYLERVKAFERRILIASVHDVLIPLNSAMLYLPRHDGSEGSTIAVEKLEDFESCRYDVASPFADDQWPLGTFPVVRAIASTLVNNAGPFEAYAVDLTKAAAKAENYTWTARLYATLFSHVSLICKKPAYRPELFGFVSEFIASSILGKPSFSSSQGPHDDVSKEL